MRARVGAGLGAGGGWKPLMDLTVCILDDHAETRTAIQDLLERGEPETQAGFGRKTILRLKVLENSVDALEYLQRATPDLAIFDLKLAQDNSTDSLRGITFAINAAFHSPSSLCILKSADIVEGGERELFFAACKILEYRGSPNLILAESPPGGRLWHEAIWPAIRQWVKKGGPRDLMRARSKHVTLPSLPEDLRSDLRSALRAIEILWEQDQHADETGALVNLMRRNLQAHVDFGPAGTTRYFTQRVCHDVVPWECALIDTKELSVNAPIVRRIAPSVQPSPFMPRKLLLVHGANTNWQAQLQATQDATKWAEVNVQACSLAEFTSTESTPADILHITLHSQGLSKDEIAALEAKVAEVGPRLLVFAACGGALIAAPPRAPYFSSTMIQSAEAVVSAQMNLEQDSLPLWLRHFYTRLLVFRDVGVAIGGARQAILKEHRGQFWWLAAMAFVREGSELALSDG